MEKKGFFNGRKLLAGWMVLQCLGGMEAGAGTIYVESASGSSDPDVCTLSDAIRSANTGSAWGGCTGGTSGPDTISLGRIAPATIVLDAVFVQEKSGLPEIDSNITIEGNASTVKRDAAATEFRIFYVNPGASLTLYDLTVADGNATDEAGGGILNEGNLTLVNCTVTNNYADAGGGIGEQNATAVIIGSRIIGNTADSGGGGIGNANASVLTIRQSTLSGNRVGMGQVSFGGGLANANRSRVEMSDCNLTGNFAGGGGAISNFGDANMTLLNVRIEDNNASVAGGILNAAVLDLANNEGFTYAIMDINRSVVKGNTAIDDSSVDNDGVGGGIVNFIFAQMRIHDTEISENRAAMGAAAFNILGSRMTLSGTTVSLNTAAVFGIVVNSVESNLTLVNSTVSGNQAEIYTGIYNGFGALGGGPDHSRLTLMYTTVTGNTDNNATTGDGIHNDANVSLTDTILYGNGTMDYNGTAPSVHANNIVGSVGNGAWTPFDGSDPLLEPLADNGGPTFTHAISLLSPAVDRAADRSVKTDQRGVRRPQGAAPDIGSFELQKFPDLNVTGNGETIRDGDVTPSVSDGTDFGELTIGSPAAVHAFDVENNGTASLELSALVLPAGYSVATAFTSPVGVGGTTSFGIRFTPVSSGQYDGTVRFDTNVSGKNPFDFAVTARVNDSDNIDFTLEEQVPNAVGNGFGDGNGDGVADKDQGDVVSFPDSNGSAYITVGIAQGGVRTEVTALPAPTDAPAGLTFPYGLFGITVQGLPKDGSGSVSIGIFTPYNADVTEYWKKDRDGNWRRVEATVEHVGSKTKVTFTLEDNGIFDLDPTDGVIVDPGGPAIRASLPVPALGGAAKGVMALLFALAAFAFRRRLPLRH